MARMGVDYYRQVDLIKEFVVAKGDSVSTLHDMAYNIPNSDSAVQINSKILKIIGQNHIVDGVAVRCPGYLLRFFNKSSFKINNKIDNVTSKVEQCSASYYRMEKTVTTRVANLHSDPKELLLPGFGYALIGAMTGSILTRRKNFIARYTVPVLFGSAVISYVLPTTFNNTVELVHDVEESLFPKFVSKQDVVMDKGRIGVAHAIMTYEIIKDKLHSAQEYIQGHINFG